MDKRGSARLRAYRRAYRELAGELGVRLAGEDNPSKAFPPYSKGDILGLIYDGQALTWEMPKDKWDRLLVLLARGIKQGNLRNGEAMTLAGKIDHYANLVNGKFECCLLIHLVQDDRSKDLLVKVGKQARVSMA